jgi:hypothetical protein
LLPYLCKIDSDHFFVPQAMHGPAAFLGNMWAKVEITNERENYSSSMNWWAVIFCWQFFIVFWPVRSRILCSQFVSLNLNRPLRKICSSTQTLKRWTFIRQSNFNQTIQQTPRLWSPRLYLWILELKRKIIGRFTSAPVNDSYVKHVVVYCQSKYHASLIARHRLISFS